MEFEKQNIAYAIEIPSLLIANYSLFSFLKQKCKHAF